MLRILQCIIVCHITQEHGTLIYFWLQLRRDSMAKWGFASEKQVCFSASVWARGTGLCQALPVLRVHDATSCRKAPVSPAIYGSISAGLLEVK